MKPGPPPKPTKLKLLEGNPGKRPINDDEPKPELGAPEKPDNLHPIASAEWDRVVPELDRLGLISKIDGASVRVYVEAVATHELAVERVRQGGVLLRRGGRESETAEPVKNPALQVVRDQAQLIRSFGAAFGLTPSDRARMALPSGDGAGDLERILNS